MSGIVRAAVVIAGLLATAAAVPRVPGITFPGADARIACTPGPKVPESAALDRQIRRFIEDGQHGRFDPRVVDVRFATLLGPHYFDRVAPIRRVTFLSAHVTCGAVTALYRVEGRAAWSPMTFSLVRGRIVGSSYT